MLKKFSANLLLATIFLTAVAFLPVTKDNFLVKTTLFYLLTGLAVIFSGKNIFSSSDLPFGFFLGAILLSVVKAAFFLLVLEFFWYVLNLYFIYCLGRSLPENFRQKVPALLWITGFLIGIYGLFQHLGIDVFVWASTYSGRPASTFGNPNFFAGYLVVLLPLLFADMQKKKFPSGLLFIFLLLLVNLFWTKTRGAWLAFGLSSIFYAGRVIFPEKNRWGSLVFTGLVFVFLGVVLISFPLIRQNPSVAERVFKWQTAREMLKQNKFTGVGANNLKVNFALYQTIVRQKNNLAVRGTSESNVHNEYCQIAAETGIVGLLGFVGIFLWYFLKIDSSDNTANSAAVVAFLFFSFTNFPLHIIPTAILCFLVMGLSQKNHEIKILPFSRPINWLFLLFLFGGNYFFGVRQFVADYWRAKGDQERENKNYLRAIFYYQKAINLDREHSEKTAYDLGEIYRFLGDYRQAIKSYEISVSLRNYAELYNNLGNCYYLLNELEPARKNWQMAYYLKMPTENDQKILENNIRQVQKKLRKEQQ